MSVAQSWEMVRRALVACYCAVCGRRRYEDSSPAHYWRLSSLANAQDAVEQEELFYSCRSDASASPLL